jgi:E3 ubiquitin-protein ligase DOA10
MNNDIDGSPSMSIHDKAVGQFNTAASEQIEAQLSSIISSAQQIAAIAEELMREFTTQNIGLTQNRIEPARIRHIIHAAAVAPLMLSATQQQLDSLTSMLQMK